MKKFLLSAVFTLLILSLFALDWPQAEGVPTISPGTNRQGHPAVGYTFKGEGPIRVAGAGELLFHAEESRNIDALPMPLGNWIAIDHGDGIISLYGNLLSIRPYNEHARYERDAIIGESGSDPKNSVYFSIFDRKNNRWVNPVLVSPQRQDKYRPTIHSVTLISSTGRQIDLSQQKTIKQGLWTVHVNASDREDSSGSKLFPLQTSCLLNGMETARIYIDTISAQNGKPCIPDSPQDQGNEIWKPYPSIELGTLRLNRGQARLEIIVQDANGNMERKIYPLSVE